VILIFSIDEFFMPPPLLLKFLRLCFSKYGPCVRIKMSIGARNPMGFAPLEHGHGSIFIPIGLLMDKKIKPNGFVGMGLGT
jgi:hypothetical protein